MEKSKNYDVQNFNTNLFLLFGEPCRSRQHENKKGSLLGIIKKNYVSNFSTIGQKL